MDERVRRLLNRGVVVPACPLALTARRTLDERRQRALCRYYAAAGAGGLAVAVHTTQFAIRDPKVGLLEPVLALAAGELTQAERRRDEPLVRIAGVCGDMRQAEREAELVRRLGYHAILVSLAALRDAAEDRLIEHCRVLGRIMPLFGFYLQPAVGGRVLPYSLWRRFLELDAVVAIKIAPFNRYQTLDVMRAAVESGRDDVALYTGNDDQIVLDLLTPFRFRCGDRVVERRIVGGLLGHWAVWTRRAVELLADCQAAARADAVPVELLRQAAEVTDANAAFFDAAHGFAGCVAGLHTVLQRQRLFEGIWCLDPAETLSPGQAEEIERVYRDYPHLNDDDFVAAGRDEWLRP
jgi:dihydrodipicolinate synthase/N-acetylneuraminate lyase